MKKVLCLVLAFATFMTVALSGCGGSGSGNVSFGMGVYSYISEANSATADKDGNAKVTSNVAAVLLDRSGKIIDADLDVADCTVSFTKDGKAVQLGEFKTKYELGDDYGMKAYANATKEWYEQADAFLALIKGKTLREVKSLVATNGKGNDDVINAGCTIVISDFVKVLEKAAVSAKRTDADANAKVSVAMVTSKSSAKDATDKEAGTNEIMTTFSAVLLDSNNKVLKSVTDAVQGAASFDNTGKTTTQKVDLETKRDKGDSYGMKAYGGAKKEWYEQADEYDKIVVGKSAEEILKLETENATPSDELQKAGCTIAVSDFIKATVKAINK